MISKQINEALKEKYSPEGSDLRRAQIRMLDMMLYLDEICRKNNIIYWLDSGTLLGAIRHGGFIPWDDDVDVCIDRKDAVRLKRAIKRNPHPDFVLQDRNTDRNHWREWFCIRDLKTEYVQDSIFHNQQKFKGLQIDVFLMEKNVNHRLWRFSVKLYNFKLMLVEKKCYALAAILHYFDSCFVFPILRCIATLFNTEHRDDYHKVYGQIFDHYYPIKSILPVKDTYFEDNTFLAPADSDSYLAESFGANYMSVPSDEVLERFNHNVSISFKN